MGVRASEVEEEEEEVEVEVDSEAMAQLRGWGERQKKSGRCGLPPPSIYSQHNDRLI